MQIKISIIIPFYNSELYIEKCVKSILSQTIKPYELILVDDGSTDSSQNICKTISAEHNFIRILKTEHRGVVNACKVGVLNSTGNYICFIDSDDTIEIEYIENVMFNIKKSFPDILIYGYNRIIGFEKTYCSPTYYEYAGLFEGVHLDQLKEELISSHQLNCDLMHFYKWNKIFNKERLIENMQYLVDNIRIFEGYIFVIPVFLDSKKVLIVDNGFYNYHLFENSAINTKLLDDYISNINFYNCVANIYKDKGVYNCDRDNLIKLSVLLSSIKRIMTANANIDEKKKALNCLFSSLDFSSVKIDKIEKLSFNKKKLLRFFLQHDFENVYKLGYKIWRGRS